MKISRRHFIGGAIATTVGASAAQACVELSRNLAPQGAALAPVTEPAPMAADMPPLLKEALVALDTHAQHIQHRDRLALVDFAVHSREPRFHIVNVESGEVEESWLVAHGSGSDPQATGALQSFSNRPGSNATSRGAYVTTNFYTGKHGRSQRLVGLDESNDMAMDRAIVIHGASYVDPALIPAQGRIGRSQGCFAFEQSEVGRVMEILGEGRLIYAGKPA